jgi:hypothetical protein
MDWSGRIHGNAGGDPSQRRPCGLAGRLETQYSVLQRDRNNIGLCGFAQGVRVCHPASQQDARLRQAAPKATDRIAHVSGAAGVEVRHAYHRDTLPFEMKDARAGDRLDTFDAGTQAVLVQELRQHEGDSFVERTAAGDAARPVEGMSALPVKADID